MLSRPELQRAVEALAATRVGARLERVVQHAEGPLVLTLKGGEQPEGPSRVHLLLDVDRRHGRLAIRERVGKAPSSPPAFAQYLRAHVEGGRLVGARCHPTERQAELLFETPEGPRRLLLSLLGSRSNVYLLDADDRIVAALRPVEKTRRDLGIGSKWKDPEPRPVFGGGGGRSGDDGPPADRFADQTGEAQLLAIEAHYAAAEGAQHDDEARRRIGQALAKQASAQDRKARALARDLAQAAEADLWRRRGELLKGHLGEVKTGADSIELEDWESGERVQVPLDPKLSAAANMERCFKRHRKGQKQGERATVEQGALEARREELAALRAEFEALPDDPAALAGFAERTEVTRILGRFFPAPAAAAEPVRKPTARFKVGKRELPARLQPKRYRTSDGLEVWVGKNDEGNDLLSTRLASGKDLFFHLEGSPGSHVVLRTGGRADPPQESVLEACELAVQFSKQKKASRAGVHVAPIKNVSKPKGAKPGLVYVHGGRTVQLRRDPARLERVLAARIED